MGYQPGEEPITNTCSKQLCPTSDCMTSAFLPTGSSLHPTDPLPTVICPSGCTKQVMCCCCSDIDKSLIQLIITKYSRSLTQSSLLVEVKSRDKCAIPLCNNLCHNKDLLPSHFSKSASATVGCHCESVKKISIDIVLIRGSTDSR